MFENEILSTGEKIKKLRKILKITQVDLTQNKYKRNYISMIENDKEKLSLKASKILAKNFNTIAKNKNIPILIKSEWFLESKFTQAKKVIKLKTEQLKNIKEETEFIRTINEIKYIAKIYNLKYLLVNAYLQASDYYFYNKNYYKSNTYCEEGFDISICDDKILASSFLVKQSRISINLGNYDESIRILKHAYRIILDIPDNKNILKNILFNLGLSYSYKNNFKKCIYYLNKLSKLDLNEKQKYSVEMLKAANYIADNELVKAKKNFIILLDIAMQTGNSDSISQCYRNLSEVYFKLHDYKQAEMYILKSLKYSNRKHGEHLYFCSKIYKLIDTKIAKQYLLDAYNYTNRNDNENTILLEKILYLQLTISIEEKNEKEIEKILDKAIKLNSNLVLLEFIKYKLTNCEKLTNRLDNIINTIKKEKEI